MLSPTGPKLTDFGIARLPDSTLTGGGAVAGDPGVQRARGPRHRDLRLLQRPVLPRRHTLRGADRRACLPGRRRSGGGHASRHGPRQKAATAVLPALRQFPHVDVIFDRALAKEAKNRFGTCEAFGNALAAELEGANAAYMMTPVPRSSIVARATRRWQNTAALGALAVIAALVVVGRFRGSEEDHLSLHRCRQRLRRHAAVAPRSASTPRAPGTGSQRRRRITGASLPARFRRFRRPPRLPRRRRTPRRARRDRRPLHGPLVATTTPH